MIPATKGERPVSFFRQLLGRRNAAAHGRKARIQISQFARTTESQYGIVWLQLEEGLIFRANPIGARIWQGLIEEKETDAIVDQISSEYGAPREEVAADVASFLADLAARRLIEVDGKAA
jgi:hypothetical protein